MRVGQGEGMFDSYRRTMMGEGISSSGQFGIRQVRLVASCESNAQFRPPQTVTIGGLLPLENPVPVSASVALMAARAGDAAVSVGVTSDEKEKEHGRSKPEVDNVAGRV